MMVLVRHNNKMNYLQSNLKLKTTLITTTQYRRPVSYAIHDPLICNVNTELLCVQTEILKSIQIYFVANDASPAAAALSGRELLYVQTEILKIGFDAAADSIQIRYIKIRFHPNSVLESFRTLPTIFRPMSIVSKQLSISATAELCLLKHTK